MSTRYTANIVRALPAPATTGAASGVWSIEDAAQQVGNTTWPAAATGADPNFRNVTLLLSGDGTNGAQNSTFVDSSTNNISLTRTGVGPSQGSFSPYGAVWSNYFDGSSYINTAATAALEFGSASFTIEFWIYPIDNTRRAIYHGSHTADWSLAIDFQSQKICIWASSNGTSWNLINADGGGNGIGSTTVALHQWTHVAFVRSGTTWQTYINGARDLNLTGISGALVNRAASQKSIGKWFFSDGAGNPTMWNGYISNFRAVRGTALYTTAFIPPTSPLTAITNTALLTCQSNRFIDNSVNNLAITATGNTAIQPFGPFNGMVQTSQGYSVAFGGTGDHLVVPATANAALNAVNGFTVEGWVYFTANPTLQFVISTAQGGSYTDSNWFVGTTSSGNWRVSYGNQVPVDTGVSVVLNTWHHFALSASSSNARFFLNGSQVSSVSMTQGNAATNFIIGKYYWNDSYFLNGFVSNIRYVAGQQLYTANFTPPTAPLTAIANTQLLVCHTDRLVDGSSNAFAITNNGDAAPRTFSPFPPTYSSLPYSADTVGGSVYFSGNGNFVTAPLAALPLSNFGTGPFTVEFWYYGVGTASFLLNGDTSTAMAIYIASSLSRIGWQNQQAVNDSLIVSRSDLANRWDHYAVCRSGTTVRLFRNGVQIGSTTNSYNYTGTSMLLIGRDGLNAINPSSTTGYVSDLLITNTARYTAPFAPPVAPLSTPTGANLHAKFSNGRIIDAAGEAVLETFGNAQISTSTVKYGTGSIAFDGTGDWLLSPPSAQNILGTGDFTIEMWVRAAALSGQHGIFNITNTTSSGSNGLGILFNTSNRLSFFVNGNATITSTTATYSINTWYHVALVRSSGTNTLYVDGVSVASSTATPTWPATPSIGVGRLYNDNTSVTLNGFVDDLRITKGVARYTANFTPPGSLPTT